MNGVVSAGKNELKCVVVWRDWLFPEPWICMPCSLLQMILVASPGPRITSTVQGFSHIVMTRGMNSVHMGVRLCAEVRESI
jgi:hypothetical protein